MTPTLGAHPLAPFAPFSSWLVELMIVFAVVGVILTVGAHRMDQLAARLQARVRGWGLVPIGLVALVVCVLVALVVLQRFPNSADEYGDLFIAETLAQGRTWNPLPEHPEFFSVIHIAEKDGKWVGRYPPGWPSVLAAASVLRVPDWLLNPILSLLTLLLLGRFAQRFVDPGSGALAMVLMAASSYFVFTAASYRSHVLAGLLILAGAYGLARFAEDARPPQALLAGLAFGLAFATRPYTTLLCALPLAGYWLSRRQPREWWTLLYVVLGALPGVAGLLAYNASITGDPLLLVTQWMDPQEGLWFRHQHTPLRGLIHAGRRLWALVEWTNPALLFVFVAYAWRRWTASAPAEESEATDRSELFAWMSLVFPALVVGHLVYHAFGGTQYGPRFYYEAYPFVILVVVDGLSRARAGAWPGRMLLAGLVFALVTLPVAGVRLQRVVAERSDVFQLVERQDVHLAVVLIATPTGVTWPMPVQDLVRNGTRIDGDVIYAHDRGAQNRLLQETFPERTFYRYHRADGAAWGTLTPLDGAQPAAQP